MSRKSCENCQVLQHRMELCHQEIQEFAALVSHDLRAPLRGIRSIVNWIEEDDPQLSTTTQEHLRTLKQQASKMDHLLDALLRYTRVGRADADLHPVSAQSAAEHALAGLSLPPGVEVHIDGPLPAVIFNDVQLKQIFQALIDNAVCHSDNPSLTIRVSYTQSPGFHEFHVEDTGPGIEERHHSRIFGLFQTLASKDEEAVSGVGLALVKKIVEQQGGAVKVESAPGAGSTFSFTIPQGLTETVIKPDDELNES